ncbi:urea amidolyase [Maritimibacter sp. 55A14]|uniref:5-oxoprolinase subunit C family protein n=1 Tax=Maritimibacter sp. 55A14 TaxID=2174844 RepID=UPI000D60EC0A|nr:biotin-dependent carboxyltransferase family protein [Maritimibacter sp. 55A14]PWE30631.1 urea amidolyase [Maritimibacter sp. 55A14]
MSGLEIMEIGAGATVQDRGRAGWQRYGVTAGGAVDMVALAEGQAILGNGRDDAALELAVMGGRFRATGPLLVAGSGADMPLKVNGAAQTWRAGVALEAGDELTLGPARGGVYGYLHVAGGIRSPVVLGARSTHLRAGLGLVPEAGVTLEAGRSGGTPGQGLPAPDYFSRRSLRAMWGPQSAVFPEEVRAGFAAATFRVTSQRDRQGVRLEPDCGPLESAEGLTIVSDAVVLGDVQVTGDGQPAVLLADRQPTGGYPRIATVIGADIHVLAQMPAGTRFRLEMVSRDAAVAALGRLRAEIAALPGRVAPLRRDPHDMDDLLAHTLIGGVVRGDEDDGD